MLKKSIYKIYDLLEFLLGTFAFIASILTIVNFFLKKEPQITFIAFLMFVALSSVFFIKILKIIFNFYTKD